MAYVGLKPPKWGSEESQEAIHRIRITLSSKNVKNLEKGSSIGPGPTPPRTYHPAFEPPTWVVEEFHDHRLGYGAIIGIAVAVTVFLFALVWVLKKLFFGTTTATSQSPLAPPQTTSQPPLPPPQTIWIPPTWTVVAPPTIAFHPDGSPIIAEIVPGPA